MTTRFNSIGLAGKPTGENDSAQRSALSSSDPYMKQYVIELPLVADAAQQDTGFTLPDHCISAQGFVRIRTASGAGAAQTIVVGIFGGDVDAILASTATTGIADFPTIPSIDLGGANVGYTLGGADLTLLEAELVLTVLASDV